MHNMTIMLRGAVVESEEPGLFVARCEALDLWSQGRTREEAEAALGDGVRLYVKHCVQRGIFLEILEARGIVPSMDDDADVEPVDNFEIKVPFGLIADAHKRGVIGSVSWQR